jgi:SAM-dependent methyltransferase
MGHIVCPWWFGYFLLIPWRRRKQDPRKLLSPFVREGMVVVEPGCGMGFFTIDLVQMVGPSGRVVAVDLQERMLAGLRRRARRAGLDGRIETRLARPDTLGITDLAGQVDLVLAFYMAHEVPDQARFFAQLHEALKPSGRMLIVEPGFHVTEAELRACIAVAEGAGFRLVSRPPCGRDRTALLERG